MALFRNYFKTSLNDEFPKIETSENFPLYIVYESFI